MRGNFVDRFDADVDNQWEILCKLNVFIEYVYYSRTFHSNFTLNHLPLFSKVMQIFEPTVYHIIYWSGQITTGRLRIDSFSNESKTDPLLYHSVLASNKQWDRIFCCPNPNNFSVSEFKYMLNEEKKSYYWQHAQDLGCYDNYEKEALLQLKLDQNDRFLIGTAGKGFIVWDFNEENRIGDGAIYLPLPHGVRNISTKMMLSNSMMVSSKLDYSVAGVRFVLLKTDMHLLRGITRIKCSISLIFFRKNLYIWCLQTRQLVKVLDAHFGRIIQLEALTIGNWNCAITSSIDRSVKVWNINNIFEQVHVIDRHELQIDHIR